MKKYLLPLFGLVVMGSACSEKDPGIKKPDEIIVDWDAAADSSSLNLVNTYWNASKKCFNYVSDGTLNFQYWPAAHALDVMVDAYERSGNNLFKTTIDDWYYGVKALNGNSFYNVFYDDMEWNALAMLRAYNAVGDEKFKTAAVDVWNDIKTGWNENAGGGIAWKKDQPWSKNACSNGPASILAARLYQQFGNIADKEWALNIYNWEKETLFNPANGAVYDNIDSRSNTIQTAWIFTYNQGTFLGAALELYKITGEATYLRDAVKAADYTLNSLVNSSQLLKSEGTGDGGLFKGIFVRYFTQLILHPDIKDADRKRYVAFMEHNAENLWTKGTDKRQLLYGPNWGEIPSGPVDLTVQLSGCMLIEAAALLDANSQF
ncbi:MAG: glycosyl hydrolase family 76 [Bacteroidales bacterium]|nr:glycosyl hydrolase family 76 [Bacteroidales bacterium]